MMHNRLLACNYLCQSLFFDSKAMKRTFLSSHATPFKHFAMILLYSLTRLCDFRNISEGKVTTDQVHCRTSFAFLRHFNSM